MKQTVNKHMTRSNHLLVVLAVTLLLFATTTPAQTVDHNQQTRPPSEDKPDVAPAPNRNGIYEGVNIQDNTVMISGNAYPTLINPSRVSTLANGNPIPLLMIPEGTRVQFYVDRDGRITSVWINGKLTQ